MWEIPTIYFGEVDYNEDITELVNSKLLEKLIEDTGIFIENRHYSVNFRKKKDGTFINYFYKSYSQRNIYGNIQKKREWYR